MARQISFVATLCIIIGIVALPARADESTAACVSSARSETNKIRNQIASLESQSGESDVGGSNSGPPLRQAGTCAHTMRFIDGDARIVNVYEMVRFEKIACLELAAYKLTHMCECRLVDKGLDADNTTMEESAQARKRFNALSSRVRQYLALKVPKLVDAVTVGEGVEMCFTREAIDRLDQVNDILASYVNEGGPSVSAVGGSGPPSISPVGRAEPPSISPIAGYPAPSAPSSDISGTGSQSGPYPSASTLPSAPVSTPSGAPTSGAGTAVSQDVLDFAKAYQKSAESLRIPAPIVAPHVAPAPHYSPPPSAPVYRQSGISGTHR